MSWKDLEDGDPELAAFGLERFKTGVAYFATMRKDGSPRVHPVTPIVGEGFLFLFMESTSPKGFDLRRDPRYAMHSAVSDTSGTSGEFAISGRAEYVEDPELRAIAARNSSYPPADRYILFVLGVDSAMATTYPADEPQRKRWRRES